MLSLFLSHDRSVRYGVVKQLPMQNFIMLSATSKTLQETVHDEVNEKIEAWLQWRFPETMLLYKGLQYFISKSAIARALVTLEDLQISKTFGSSAMELNDDVICLNGGEHVTMKWNGAHRVGTNEVFGVDGSGFENFAIFGGISLSRNDSSLVYGATVVDLRSGEEHCHPCDMCVIERDLSGRRNVELVHTPDAVSSEVMEQSARKLNVYYLLLTSNNANNLESALVLTVLPHEIFDAWVGRIDVCRWDRAKGMQYVCSVPRTMFGKIKRTVSMGRFSLLFVVPYFRPGVMVYLFDSVYFSIDYVEVRNKDNQYIDFSETAVIDFVGENVLVLDYHCAFVIQVTTDGIWEKKFQWVQVHDDAWRRFFAPRSDRRHPHFIRLCDVYKASSSSFKHAVHFLMKNSKKSSLTSQWTATFLRHPVWYTVPQKCIDKETYASWDRFLCGLSSPAQKCDWIDYVRTHPYDMADIDICFVQIPYCSFDHGLALFVREAASKQTVCKGRCVRLDRRQAGAFVGKHDIAKLLLDFVTEHNETRVHVQLQLQPAAGHKRARKGVVTRVVEASFVVV